MNLLESDDSGEPPDAEFWKYLERLKQAIFLRRPVLKDIISKHGEKTLYAYSQDFLDVNESPRLDARKHELVTVCQELVSKRLGQEVGAAVGRQLKKLALVSTAEHHGPVVHPLFVNSAIISAIPYFDATDPDLQYLIAFSFASVSVNNASAFPRGIEFHGGMNGSGNFIRLPILPDKLKMGVVYGTRAFTREDLTKSEQELAKKEKTSEIAPGRGDEIRCVMEEHFGAPDVLNTEDLASQITKINFHLWPKLLSGSRKKIPDLIYLDIETLVTELLIRYHLYNKSSLLHRVLFDPEFQKTGMGYFDNLVGGFSLKNRSGTYFFWAMDDKWHRVRLELDTAKLFSPKRVYEFDMTPEGIEKGLREKRIFPSMLLCYLMISLYYGMKCLGGFCQVHDLTMLKEAWGKMLRELGENEEAEAVTPVQTKELGGDGLVLSYLKTAKGEFVPATGIDMALEKEHTSFEFFVEFSKKLTLAELLNPMLPEIYTVLYSSFQRDPNMLKYSPEQIFKETGLEGKIRN